MPEARAGARGTPAATIVLDTDRLRLRRLSPEDAPFILELLNDPDWLRYIGDKGVRTLDDARGYIETGPVAMYARHGFGLYLVERKDTGASIGLCGLIKREMLEDVDLGFAFLPHHRRHGYAYEAAAASIAHARDDFGMKRLIAITSRDNHASMDLLGKLGFEREGTLRVSADTDALNVFGRPL